MDKKTDAAYVRLPAKLKILVESYAREHGLTLNQAIIHLLARGIHYDQSHKSFSIENYTSNFFEDQ